jgi:hypothetical protein
LTLGVNLLPTLISDEGGNRCRSPLCAVLGQQVVRWEEDKDAANDPLRHIQEELPELVDHLDVISSLEIKFELSLSNLADDSGEHPLWGDHMIILYFYWELNPYVGFEVFHWREGPRCQYDGLRIRISQFFHDYAS